MSRAPRKLLPLPDSDAPKTGRPPPPLPSVDNGPAPPLPPGRRAPPPIPPSEPEKHSDSSYESDSEFEGDSDESYEKMRDKLSPPAIPNRGYRQLRDNSPPSSPRSSRGPPRLPPTRNLPPLPGGRRGPQPIPTKPDEQEVYDDGEAGDIYEEDVEVGDPEDVYDDGEVGGLEVYNDPEEDKPPPIPAAPRRELPPPPPQSTRPPPPLPEPAQDVYEVEPEPDPVRPQTPPEESGEGIYEMEPVVSDQPSTAPPELPGRPPVPTPPQETYEIQDDDEQENYDEFSMAEEECPQDTYDEFEAGPQEVYEDVDEKNQAPQIPGRPMPPPPPSVPSPPKPTPPTPKKVSAEPRQAPRPPIGGGPMGFDISAIKGVQLKKVGLPVEDKQKAKESDKIYDEDGGVKSAFEKFKQKDLESSKTKLFPKSAASVATALKKPVTAAKPDFFPRPVKKPEPNNLNTKPTPPEPKSPMSPSFSKPRSPSPSKESPPPPPPVKSVPDKPPVPYSQVKPNVSNGTKMNIEEDHVSSDDEDDDIYDDAISNRDPLLGEPWYFKSLKDRKTGDKMLKKVGKDGTFLIRESTKQGNFQPYTMMVLFQNNVYNLKIRVRADGKMALGEEKPDEMSFMDVQKLVKYHRDTEVILVGNTGQHKTLLKYSPPQNSM